MCEKIKLLIFDLDGVLVNSRDLHYYALNDALSELDEKYRISYEEHLAKYDGNPTSVKLKRLTEEKGLSPKEYNRVWERKQYFTLDAIKKYIKMDHRLIDIFEKLSKDYKIYCASNAIYKSIINLLHAVGLDIYFDFIMSNEEIKHPKPNPEIYLRCIMRSGLTAKECLIFEDSDVGRKAGYSSGAHVCPIINPEDVTYEKIIKYIKMSEEENKIEFDIKWKNDINIVIPMAGLGSRFSKAGYTFPKPLIEVDGEPMISLVVKNLNIDGTYIFIVRKEHAEKYNLDMMFKLITHNKYKMIITDTITEGAACSVMLAKEYINNDTPLLIANSDQFVEWNSNRFLYCASSVGVDGCILTFINNHPKWSYVKLESDGFVSLVKEKEVISDKATVGIYYWARGKDYVKCAEQMISKNIRVNGEFYTCPVYNELISNGGKVKIFDCDEMWGLGTPEDLQYFIQNKKF